uniref:Uncharacterized protein n=1 Tax=Alexandrium catenella TaxID=2925 RepID=A0A7S1WU77_ALECA|mmetsp:Transcript_90782/g.241238  ORF Transcript_90782/g.241238 Transcript_90782/m.241238 type:complete len:177 (+) Transcript_90782:72-602(+)
MDALCARYEAILGDLDRAIDRQDDAEAARCARMLCICAGELGRHCSWERVDAVLEHGVYDREARKRLQERYALWQAAGSTAAAPPVAPAPAQPVSPHIAEPPRRVAAPPRRVAASCQSGRTARPSSLPAGRFVEASRPEPPEGRIPRFAACWGASLLCGRQGGGSGCQERFELAVM